MNRSALALTMGLLVGPALAPAAMAQSASPAIGPKSEALTGKRNPPSVTKVQGLPSVAAQ
jgi:hypothetical protein